MSDLSSYVLDDGTNLSGPSARRLFDSDATISRLTAEQEHLLSTNDRLFHRAVAAELRVKELEKTLDTTLASLDRILAKIGVMKP